jgi:hypothetical protein
MAADRRTLEAQLSTLISMTPARLRAEWRSVYKTEPPPLTADLLARGVAWKLQQRVHGGLPPATTREIRRMKAELDKAGGSIVTLGRIRPGTRLVRDWGGAAHHVLVLERGYLYRDRHYASLSQVARDITGAHWSGPRFFGTRREASARG